MTNRRKTVFVAMSGGVDSSVAAALLKKRGFNVIGAHIKGYNIDGCGEKDAQDAFGIAKQLNIPFYVFDMEKEYKEKVVDYMVAGYRAGLTPNPDIMCNKEIKFGLFLRKALQLGADCVATGHYVKLKRGALYIAKDKSKDQSYFLWTLTPKQLKYCLFPIGEHTKSQVRKMAKKFSLITASKKDSQGICFLGKVSMTEFLKKYIPSKRGVVLAVDGKKLGEHEGAAFYTIGQRSGLGIGGAKQPLYIANKNINKNTIAVAEGKNHPSLYKKEIGLVNLNFLDPNLKIPKGGLKVFARVRYRQPLAAATLYRNRLVFSKPQKFIAPGQSTVFYSKKGGLLGGGTIV